MALLIILVIIITQGACLAMAAVLRPWLSAFLNFLEVTCGTLDVATMIIMAIAYRAKMISTSEQMVGIAQVIDRLHYIRNRGLVKACTALLCLVCCAIISWATTRYLLSH